MSDSEITGTAAAQKQYQMKRLRQQLKQHTEALLYLCFSCKPGSVKLTAEMLMNTYKILMHNMPNDQDPSGPVIAAGCYRTGPSTNGAGYAYAPADTISDGVEAAISKFNTGLTGGVHPIQLAADIFYELLDVHPFEDGNGRTCRLIASYALMCCGVPFPVPLTNGHRHSNSRKHLINCFLKIHRQTTGRGCLYTYFLMSLSRCWNKYLTMNQHDTMNLS